MQGEKVGEERKWKSGENKSEREKKKEKKSAGNKSERKGNICGESGESEMKTEKRKRMKEPVSFVPENINLEKKGRGGG